MWKHSWSAYLGGTSLSHIQLATALLWVVGRFVCDSDEVILQGHCCGRYCMWHDNFFFWQGHMCLFEHITCQGLCVQLTYSIVPSVDGKEPAAGDSDHSRYSKMGEGVCSHMRYRRIGRKLQHHNDILLHLVLKHERTLWKETLLNRREKKRSVGKVGRMWWREQQQEGRRQRRWIKEIWDYGRRRMERDN